ncbi:cupin domain-containing protein [Bradyrhizobium sp. Pear77]|uniref:cupin domain-containing protein n=1 Tax=Bradyrhizobium altum TaxID=1571202 RepID=UPI001E2E2401|nr:cupin domain-containing protein [Bradyrhizobium altum]MCC8952851.1 cupin domain-containing protein [Bradyrhizobium altum]
MHTKAMKTRLGLLYLLAAVVVVLALSSISRPVFAAERAFIVLPGEASRYGGQQGREGDFTELLATADETGGVLGIFRQTIAPKSGPPTHLHGMEAEFCYVVSGQFNFKLGESIVSAPAGAFVFIPRVTPHTFQNIGTEPGVLLFGVTPGGFEKMFAERQGVDADTNQKLMAKHHMQVVGPPLR